MPLWKNGEATTTKVLDTFYALPGGALSEEAVVQVVWPGLDLGGADLGLLRSLCTGVGYLGRAESWVEMKVVDGANIKPNARPILSESDVGRGDAVGRVLVPLNQQGMNGFVAAMGALPRPKKGRTWWESPSDVLGALEVDIGALHRQGWHGIPGSQWALYELQAVKAGGRSAATKSLEGAPAMARFALSSRVLPRITAALSVGERFHQALMAWSRDGDGRSQETFVGRDLDGNPLARNHDHAWYLPECNDRGEITHVVVYSRCGFEEGAVKALQGIGKVWGSEGFDIAVDLVSLGRLDAGMRLGMKRLLVTGEGRVWRSLTPFVLTRFPKRKAIDGSALVVDGPEDQALRLLRLLGLGLEREDGRKVVMDGWLCWCDGLGEVLVRVRVVEGSVLDGGVRFAAQRFQRQRSHGQGQRSLGQGFWLEVAFSQVVRGPIALGYGAHFGLGVLVGAEG
jgi:CRISPR-associated protein Csb2